MGGDQEGGGGGIESGTAPAMSRRQFLSSLTKGVAGLGVSAAVLAACEAPAASPTAPSTTTGSATSAPVTSTAPDTTVAAGGGELRIDILADPTPGLDPVSWSGPSIQRVYRLTNESLYTWDASRTVVPELAAALPEISEDRLRYTVTIRDGVSFHNGKQLGSDDVKFTFELIAAEESTSQWKSHLALVSAIDAPDPATVVFTLAEVFTPFLSTLARIPIVPADVPYVSGETYLRETIGTGPFRFVEWVQGGRIVVERNPDYWGDGQPVVDRVVLQIVPEDAVRSGNVLAEMAHIVPEPAPSQLQILQSGGVMVNIAPESTKRVFLYPNLDPERFTGASYAARRAIAEAIDRGAISEAVFFGAAVPASTHLSSGADYFDPELGSFFGDAADPESARSFLEEAGGAPAEQLSLHVVSDPLLVDAAALIQSGLAALGIPVAIFVETVAEAVERLTVTQDYDLVLMMVETQSASGFGSEYPYLGASSDSPGNLNGATYGYPADPEYDRLLTAAVQAPEGAESASAWHEVQRYDVEQALHQIQIVTARYVEAVHASVQEYQTSSLGGPYNVKFASVASA